jgi:hypothetical protein
MKDTYSFEQTFTGLQYVRLGLYTLSVNKYIRRLFIFIAIISISGAVLSFYAHGENEVVTTWSLISYAIGPPLSILLFFSVLVALVCLFMVKFKPDSINGVRYTFTHWGMERVARNGEITVPWRDFIRLKETKGFLFIYIKNDKLANAVTILKLNFKDPA